MALITLTFDNGPEPNWTNHVLDVLAEHEIKATFFVIGRKLATIPGGRAAVERAKKEGHWIGNHSWNHVYSLGDIDRPDAFKLEVVNTFEELGELAHPDLLFRPYCNAGIVNDRVFRKRDVEDVCAAQYSCVLFNAIPRDWNDGTGWVARGLDQVAKQPWSTVVLHDIAGYPDGIVTAEPMRKLDEFIRRAMDTGHEFTQDFSPDCVLIRKGEKLQDMSKLAH